MESMNQRINKLESSFDPNDVTISHKGRDFEVYPWVKPYIFSAIQSGNKPDSGNTSKWFQLKKIFIGLMYLFKKSDTIIFSFSMEQRIIDGKLYDKIFHAIEGQEKLGRVTFIESIMPSLNYPSSLYQTKRRASHSLLYLRQSLYAKFFLNRLVINNKGPLQKLIDENDLNIDLSYAIRKNISQYKIMLKFLKRTKPKQVFILASYTNFGLILACKELKIKVIELQHGVINNEHFGYTYFYPPETNQFPDYLLTLGHADVHFISKGELAKFIKPHVLGSFIIDYYLKNKASYHCTPRQVAISLQDCETGIASVKDFIELAREFPHVQFALKRRRLSREYYEKHFNFPSNMRFAEEDDIYKLIIMSEVHLTAYSSCALEAPSLGVRNILYNLNDKARKYYSEKLTNAEINRYCDSVDSLKTELSSLLNNQVDRLTVINSNVDNIASNYHKNLDNFMRAYLLGNS